MPSRQAHEYIFQAGLSRGQVLQYAALLINDLEQRTKTNLFDRDVRPLGLTLSGVVLRQRASALLADARQIGPLLQEVRRGRLPLIRVGLIDSFSRLLVPRLPDHLDQHFSRLFAVSYFA